MAFLALQKTNIKNDTIHIYIFVNVYGRLYIFGQLCKFILLAYVYIYMRVCKFICTSIYLCTFVYIYVDAHMFIHIRIHA